MQGVCGTSVPFLPCAGQESSVWHSVASPPSYDLSAAMKTKPLKSKTCAVVLVLLVSSSRKEKAGIEKGARVEQQKKSVELKCGHHVS
jgi:hypothetical protein